MLKSTLHCTSGAARNGRLVGSSYHDALLAIFCAILVWHVIAVDGHLSFDMLDDVDLSSEKGEGAARHVPSIF